MNSQQKWVLNMLLCVTMVIHVCWQTVYLKFRLSYVTLALVLHVSCCRTFSSFVWEEEPFFAIGRIWTKNHYCHVAIDIFVKRWRDGAAVPLTHLIVQHVINSNVIIPKKSHVISKVNSQSSKRARGRKGKNWDFRWISRCFGGPSVRLAFYTFNNCFIFILLID